jgi:hypothetical protein
MTAPRSRQVARVSAPSHLVRELQAFERYLVPYGLGLRLVWLDRPSGTCPMCGGGPAVHDRTHDGRGYCTDHLDYFEIRQGHAHGLMRTFGTGKPWGIGPRMMRTVQQPRTENRVKVGHERDPGSPALGGATHGAGPLCRGAPNRTRAGSLALDRRGGELPRPARGHTPHTGGRAPDPCLAGRPRLQAPLQEVGAGRLPSWDFRTK